MKKKVNSLLTNKESLYDQNPSSEILAIQIIN